MEERTSGWLESRSIIALRREPVCSVRAGKIWADGSRKEESRNLDARRLDSRSTPDRSQTMRASSDASKIACHHEARISPSVDLDESDNIAGRRACRVSNTRPMPGLSD